MQEYLDHKLECPYCGTIRLRIPAVATDSTEIKCDDCGELLGTWGDLQDDFAKQGGHDGVFRLSSGRIKRIG
jgi:DNA-directed RNA polymerase subunit RPC12/RpoP